MTGRKKTKRWSYIAGEKGRNRVRAFELPSGLLHLEYTDEGNRRSISVGSRDRAVAKQKADELAARFGEAILAERSGELTLGVLFDNYLHEVTPGKTVDSQHNDRRRATLWLDRFGRNQPVAALNGTHAKLYIDERRARGDLRRGVGGQKRNAPVRPRSWRSEISFLKSAISWAMVRGLLLGAPGILVFRDRTKSEVRRPMVTNAEVEVLLEAAKEISDDCYCFAVLAHETGHRSGAIRQLRWSDINLTSEEVRWRPELDKIGYDHTTPLSAVATQVLKRHRERAGAIGDVFLFPAPKVLGRPASKSQVRDWWRRMERIAELQPVPSRGWHSLRRKMANDLKHQPTVDVAALVGWKDTTTITRIYQQADAATVRAVLLSRRDSIPGATAEETAEVSRIVAEKRKPRLG